MMRLMRRRVPLRTPQRSLRMSSLKVLMCPSSTRMTTLMKTRDWCDELAIMASARFMAVVSAWPLGTMCENNPVPAASRAGNLRAVRHHSSALVHMAQ